MKTLRRTVYRHFLKHGRKFPWRETRDPYRILVSEVMLQQTQAGERTISKFGSFMDVFPSVTALSRASITEVYKLWQGLGYNRRAKALRDAALKIINEHRGSVPSERAELEALPGVGPYTAGAVRVFAFNKPEVLIETNIRTVFIHHFFPRARRVHDKKLLPLIEQAIDRKNPRKWYSALMDYGAALKRLEGNLSRKSRHYVRQDTFAGSTRDVRGQLLRILSDGTRSEVEILKALKVTKPRVTEGLRGLKKDGMVVFKRGRWSVA